MKKTSTKFPSNYVAATDSIYATKAYTKGYVESDPLLVSANGNFKLIIRGGIGIEDTPYTNFEIVPSKKADGAVIDIRINDFHGSYQGMPVINLPRKNQGEYATVSYGFTSNRTGNVWVRDIFIPTLTEAVDFADEVNDYFDSTSREQLSEMCKDVFLDMGIDYDSYIQQEADADL